MMMISKETFVKTLNDIQKQMEIDTNFDNALKTVCESYPVYQGGKLYFESLLNLLEEIFQDKESQWISWWLFEDVEKTVSVTDKNKTTKEVFDLSSPSLLYDFLIREMNEKNEEEKKEGPKNQDINHAQNKTKESEKINKEEEYEKGLEDFFNSLSSLVKELTGIEEIVVVKSKENRNNQ